jgi:hypothetical protein
MAKGFYVRRATKHNPTKRVTLVNPNRPKVAHGWVQTARKPNVGGWAVTGRVDRPTENPKKQRRSRVKARVVSSRSKKAGYRSKAKPKSKRATRYMTAGMSKQRRRQSRIAAGTKRQVKKAKKYGRVVKNRRPKANRRRMSANKTKRWMAGTIHPVTRKPVGGVPMTMEERKKYTRKGKLRSAVRAAAVRKGLVKPKKATKKARRAPKKGAKRAAPKKGRKVRARKTRKAAGYYVKKAGAPRGRVWRKGHKAASGKWIRGMYVKKGGKKVRRAKKTAYRRTKKARVSRRRTKTGTITVTRKKMSYASGGKRGRYRVRTKAKRYHKKTYLRRRPKRHSVKHKSARYTRRYPRGYVRRSRGGKVHVSGYTRRDGKRVKGHYKSRPKRGRYIVSGSGRARRMAANKGRRNPYKRSKITVRPKSKRYHVKSYKRRQWYPTRHPRRGKGRWITQSRAHGMGLMGIREARKFGFAANPAALAMLPTKDQLIAVSQAAGVGAIGFGSAVAIGQLFGRLNFAQRYLGTWAPVVGNVLGGLGLWTVANYIDNPKVNEMKPYLAIGAGVAALVNVVINLIARGTVPSRYASWLIPGAGAVAAAPEAALQPGAEATSGFGQIDVYEAALDGVGDIEQDLEMELERMSGFGGGADGILSGSSDGIFGEYLETPMGADVEEAYAGLGANVEEAFAGGGSGGTGEYLETPMGEYLETPMGADVSEAYAGVGEYLETPMGAYVEEAYGTLGADDESVTQEVAQSIVDKPLMPGFRAAVQKVVRKRIAAGKPLDDSFYQKLGTASAALAKKKFRRRVAEVQGQPMDLPMTKPRGRLTRKGAVMYKRQVASAAPGRMPGAAEPIPGIENGDNEGIFFNGGEGIL